MEATPKAMPHPFHAAIPPRAGPVTATSTTPAFTMVAAWRYALTGVGATIAPGSHGWNGTWADLVAAAIITSTAPAVAAVPSTGASSLISVVSAAPVTSSRPASRTRPPPAVTIKARRAATRTSASVLLCATRRNEVTDVSSQNTNSVQTESAQTRPSIAVEKASKVDANLPVWDAPGLK